MGFDWQGGGVPLVPGLMAHLERGLLCASNRHIPGSTRAARAGSVVLARSGSLVLFILGVILERGYLAGEQTSVLGIPVDRFE